MKKHIVLIISIFLFSFCLQSCFSKKQAVLDSPQGQTAIQTVPDPMQKTWSTWSKILMQANAVEREAWWVLTDQKSKGSVGSFSRLQRALEKQTQGLKKNKVLACEQFELRKDILDPVATEQMYKMKGQLFEICEKPGFLILDFEYLENRKLKLMINPEHQTDVFGLGAAIFNKQIVCVLTWNEKEILTNLKCENYKRNRSPKEIVELDTFDYQFEAKNILSLKGKISENLSVKRKIETQIPLDGKITDLETEIEKVQSALVVEPQDNLDKPKGSRFERKNENPMTSGANPDLLKRKLDNKLKNFNPPIESLPNPELNDTEEQVGDSGVPVETIKEVEQLENKPESHR